ncbi:septal ring lytic transglycosylase RlpA family protein [Carboxylicivirga sp. N1Y90]|uniref:septal ring lytic transglycosylase RlpA family protein n=1 Tax=Carboxylicivirga fragile TaxID=3417571 RepID=UPI003D35461D|nr:septal ring lytic transglycosylase RlpA family protein [Marinilabiliaceae bacterium N1Y90]
MRAAVLFIVSVISLSCFAQELVLEGKASYYAAKFEGRLTANGEVFSNDSLTAAHKTLPFGTKVKVINLDNKKSITVRINDRGPFIKGRIIDLSQAAANELNFIQQGIANVRIEINNKATQTSSSQQE